MADSNSPYLDLTRQQLLPQQRETKMWGIDAVTGEPIPSVEGMWGIDAVTGQALPAVQSVVRATSGTPFWGTDPGAYDTVIFAKNIVLPGQCSVRGKGFSQKLQRDQPPGTHGASTKQLGCKPATIDITVQLWTEEHLREFERLVPMLKSQRMETRIETEQANFSPMGINAVTGETTGPDAGAWGLDLRTGQASTSIGLGTATITRKRSVPVGPAPMDVYHPMLALFRIRSVLIVDVEIPEPKRDGDVWESRIRCEEYIPSSLRNTEVKKADSSLEVTQKNLGPTAYDVQQRRGATGSWADNAPKPSEQPITPGKRTGTTGSW